MNNTERRRIRILYYVEGLDIGGANQSTVTTAVAMKRRGHEVFYASLDGPLRGRLEAAGIPHIPVDTNVVHPSRWAARQLRQVLDREKIDVLCSNGWDCTMDALLATAFRGIPLIPTFPGMFVPQYAHPRVPRAIVYSGEYRDALIRRFGWSSTSLEMLINRIDTDRFQPGRDGLECRTRWGLGAEVPLVLMACRHDPAKIGGVNFLLDAVKPLAERMPSARVVLAGDGERHQEVAERVDRLHQEIGHEVVILAGTVLEMDKALAAADVVVGNGARSGLEGFASGKPVVSVGPAGLAGVFSPENIEDFAYYNFDKGLVYDGSSRQDPEALAAEIQALMEDPERRARLGSFGREYSLQRLSISAGEERLEALLLAARRRNLLQRLSDAGEFVRSLTSFATQAAGRKLSRVAGNPVADLPQAARQPAPPRGFFQHSATTFLTAIFGLGVGVIQAAVIARVLQPQGKGEMAAALLLPQLLVTLAPLGINWASTYHLGRKTFDRELLVRTVLTALMLLSGAGMAICFVAGYLMRDSILSGVSTLAFFLAVFTVPTQISFAFLTGLFRGEMRIADANRMDIGRSLLMFLGIVLALTLFHLGVTGVILAQVAAEAWVAVVAFQRFGGVRPIPTLRWDILRKLLTFGVQVYSFAILLYLTYRFDLFLVRRQLDLIQTGLYATAVSLAEILWMVPNSLGIVLFPSVARSSGPDRDRLTLAVLRNSFWLMLTLCALLGLARNLVLQTFFGASFVPAGSALLAILPGILAMSIQQVLGSALSGRGHPLAVTLGAGIGFVVNVALNLAWIPRYGIVGASLASSVSYTLVAIVVLVAFLRITKSSLREAFVLGREDWDRIAGFFVRLKEAFA